MQVRKTIFVRDATGLVRDWSWHDGFIYSALAMPGIWWVITIAANTYTWPNANPALGALVATIAFVPQSIVYALIAASMPRAGGDYVYQSRVIHPAVGYVVVGTLLIITQWWAVYYGPTMDATAFSPFFLQMATITGNQWFLSVSNWFTTTQAWVLLTYLVIMPFMWVVNVFGLRVYGGAQKICFYIALGCYVALIAIILGTSHSTFITNFNAMAQTATGQSNSYQNIITAAQKAGFSPSYNFSLYETVGSIAAWSPLFAYMMMSTYMAGEIKKAGTVRGQLYMNLGSLLLIGALAVILAGSIDSLVGRQFNGAANYLFNAGTFPLSVPPYVGLYAVASFPSIITPIIVLVFFNAFFWMNMVNGIPQSSRIALAMAFDRMFPAKMADVSERFHTPVINITIWVALAAAFPVIYYLIPAFANMFFIIPLTSSATFIFTSLSGALLPYRAKMKNVYDVSPASRYKLAGLPVITIAGVLSVLVWLFIDSLIVTDPRLGVAGTNLNLSLAFYGTLIGAFAVLYVAYYLHNRKQGIDVSQIFQQIPPE